MDILDWQIDLLELFGHKLPRRIDLTLFVMGDPGIDPAQQRIANSSKPGRDGHYCSFTPGLRAGLFLTPPS